MVVYMEFDGMSTSQCSNHGIFDGMSTDMVILKGFDRISTGHGDTHGFGGKSTDVVMRLTLNYDNSGSEACSRKAMFFPMLTQGNADSEAYIWQYWFEAYLRQCWFRGIRKAMLV